MDADKRRYWKSVLIRVHPWFFFILSFSRFPLARSLWLACQFADLSRATSITSYEVPSRPCSTYRKSGEESPGWAFLFRRLAAGTEIGHLFPNSVRPDNRMHRLRLKEQGLLFWLSESRLIWTYPSGIPMELQIVPPNWTVPDWKDAARRNRIPQSADRFRADEPVRSQTADNPAQSMPSWQTLQSNHCGDSQWQK